MHNKVTQLIRKMPLFILIWIIAYCPNSAAQSSGIQSRREKVQRILREFQDKSGFPGAIAGVYFADGSSLAVAVGYADRDTKKQMRESDRLHAGSVGKTFFAALALQLVSQRRLSLDDPIAKYLGREPWFQHLPNANAITVRMLLNHTSGLPSYGNKFIQEL